MQQSSMYVKCNFHQSSFTNEQCFMENSNQQMFKVFPKNCAVVSVICRNFGRCWTGTVRQLSRIRNTAWGSPGLDHHWPNVCCGFDPLQMQRAGYFLASNWNVTNSSFARRCTCGVCKKNKDKGEKTFKRKYHLNKLSWINICIETNPPKGE